MKECNIVKQSPLAGLAAYGGGSGSLLFGRKGVGGYTIERSLRFNPDDSPYLSRADSNSNQKTVTFSFWIKKLGTQFEWPTIYSSTLDGSNGFTIRWNVDRLQLYVLTGGSYGVQLTPSRKFRDYSGWLHVVAVVDTTASTESDRAKFYFNGVEHTSGFDFTTSYPSLNENLKINVSGQTINIGRRNYDSAQYINAYLADFHFIDGQALAPTEFGEFNSNGIWDPKEFTGSFGTNGFHLKFDDASSPDALGTDSSGNNNTFSVNNISVSTTGLSTADKGFGILTYTGNQTARNISGLSFAPDLVIVKSRSDNSYNHYWVDRVRGAGKNLYSNLTEAEHVADRLSSFNSDGIGLTNHMGVNKTGSEFVAWCWKAGGSASSNTDGTITGSVSANTTYGFSIVGYTGNNTSGATVGHGLSSVPKWIVIKSRGQNGQFWHVYHASLAANEYIYLNSTSAKTSGNDFMNGTRPTSSVFSLGNGNGCNKSSDDVIAYCWAEISGFSKFDSWTGNGSSTGPTITTGFKPRFLLWKRTDSTTNWYIYDTDRQTGNPLNKNLEPNTGDAENTMTSMNIDFLSNGFQIKGTDGDVNANGGTYIYAAFAEKPDTDSLFDSPVDGTQTDTGAGGEVSGNYATLNPLAPHGLTLSNGNLDGSGSVIQGHAPSTIFASSGKFYCEFTLTTYQNDTGVGVAASIANPGEDWIGEQPYTIGYLADGRLFQNSSSTSYSSYAAGDVIGAAFDVATGKVWFHKNGTYLNSGNPAAGTGQVGTITGGYDLGFTFRSVGGAGSFNFGAKSFVHSAPSGFKALCTTNLPTPTIADGSTAFDAKLWTGDGSSSRAITGYNYSPDFVWIKIRNDAYGHAVFDSVRGPNIRLDTVGNNPDQTITDGLLSFNSNGFTIGNRNTVGENNKTYVAWAWDAGANSNKTYTVKVVSDSGNKYRFDDFGTSAVTLDLEEGSTYVFDQSDSSNSGHPLRFSTTSDGTHGGGSEYTTGVTTTGTPGSAGAKTTIVVAASAPTLYYYCSNHSGMGGQADTNSTAGASNFDGSIQATVKANQTAGFSIATISSATGSTTADLGHGLNAQPHFIIQKSRTNTYSWQVYHIGSGSYKYGNLNGTGPLVAATTGNMGITPNSSTVGLGSDFTGSNGYVYYIFAPVAGYSSFGLATGNNSTDGPFIYTGFRPKFIIWRPTANGHSWMLIDTERDTYNVADATLRAQSANAEVDFDWGDVLSNGFKIRNTDTNPSGVDIVWAAWAENPFKTARAR